MRQKLSLDGLDPAIYGYPSGIFGLRLMLNPDFFGKTADAAKARAYWKERVEGSGGRYYTNSEIHADPKLIRPFRVSMSCGFCHVAPHPLNPPAKDKLNEPNWENLSSIIGGQYWDPQPAFGNLLKRPNFLHHFLKSQAPGTVDTSLVSTGSHQQHQCHQCNLRCPSATKAGHGKADRGAKRRESLVAEH